ncbi:unnamed protein product [Fusarium venenatum]|uniref:FAR1 domain-containing protein n=1 Tax=Fusarium venenatum TaxID=56646 RepID=A0A2L2TTQ7_9HYPO|nr:uncharacterized protein FVRRES_00007 [Fusarium venenatum]CEI63495.1 unnamed protein product [Fusarium venenatum]
MLLKAILATAITATSAVAAPLEARDVTTVTVTATECSGSTTTPKLSPPSGSSSYFSPSDTWQYSVHNGAIAAAPNFVEIYKSTGNGGKDQSALVTFTYPVAAKGRQCQLEFHLPAEASPAGSKKIQVFSSNKPAPGPTSSWAPGNQRGNHVGTLSVVAGGAATWDSAQKPSLAFKTPCKAPGTVEAFEFVGQSSSPTPDPIPNPPIPGDAAPSAEVLFNWVNTFAKDHGFGIVRRNAYSYKGRKIRYSFQCDRFREPRPAEGVGIRQRKSRKCGCKWMVVAEALEEGKWLLRQHSNPEHSQHNHGRSIGTSAHPSHRRLTTAIRATIESTSRRVGILARDVRAVVREQHPESVFTQRDIYNARSLINYDKFDKYTSTAALIKLFDEREIPYLVKWVDDNPERLLGLV